MMILLSSLIAAVTIQLSSATHTPATSTNSDVEISVFQERYQIFDSFLLKVNNITTNEMLDGSAVYPHILKEYNDWLLVNKENITGHNSELYPELKKCLNNLIMSVEMLKKDRNNCELEREMQRAFFELEVLRLEINNEEVNKIWENRRQYSPFTDAETFRIRREFKNNYFRDLKAKVQHFVQRLDNAGKEENKDLVEWFNKFRSARTHDLKNEAYDEFQDLYEGEFEREKNAGDVNCRLKVPLEYGNFITQIVLMMEFIEKHSTPEPKIA